MSFMSVVGLLKTFFSEVSHRNILPCSLNRWSVKQAEPKER